MVIISTEEERRPTTYSFNTAFTPGENRNKALAILAIFVATVFYALSYYKDFSQEKTKSLDEV